jgi:tetratricopeptide (TPR) repeat protein
MRETGKRKLKGKLKSAVMLTLCAMLCLTGCGSQAKKVVKQLTLGEEYMESEDYEKAVEAYEAALALDEYSIEGYTGLITAMVKNESPAKEIYAKAEEGRAVIQKLASSDEGMTDEQTENAADFYKAVVDAYEDTDADDEAILAVMKEGAEILGKDSDIAEKYTDKISELVSFYMDGKDFESAKQYAGELSDVLPESDTAKELSEQTETIYNEEQPYVDTLLKAVEYIDAGDWQGLADFADTDEVKALNEKIGDVGNYVYVYGGGTTGKGIGMYSMEGCDCNEWYYGDMVDGKREGQGSSYWCSNFTKGLYIENWVGEWSGDAPNGSQHEYHSYNGEVEEQDVTVVDGLYDGEFTYTVTVETGEVLSGPYTVVKGVPQAVEVEDWIKPYIADNEICYWIQYYIASNGHRNAEIATTLDTTRLGMSHYRHNG